MVSKIHHVSKKKNRILDRLNIIDLFCIRIEADISLSCRSFCPCPSPIQYETNQYGHDVDHRLTSTPLLFLQQSIASLRGHKSTRFSYFTITWDMVKCGARSYPYYPNSMIRNILSYLTRSLPQRVTEVFHSCQMLFYETGSIFFVVFQKNRWHSLF